MGLGLGWEGRGTSETGESAGWRVEVSKLEEDSGSRRSMLMVRQLSVREAVVTCWIMDILEEGGSDDGLWRCGVEFGGVE